MRNRQAGGQRRHIFLRQTGDCDIRLLPVAVAMWACAICLHQAADAEGVIDGVWHVIRVLMWCALAVGILCVGFSLLWRRSASGVVARVIAGQIGVMFAACLCLCVSFGASEASAWLSTSFAQTDAAAGDTEAIKITAKVPVHIVARVNSPPIASTQRGSDCQFDAALLAIRLASVAQPAHESVRIFASDTACRVMPSGAYSFSGKLMPPRYGTADAWVIATGRCVQVQAPRWSARIIVRMQTAFLRQCARLSAQGRLLVPGVTLGVLGSDAVIGDSLSQVGSDLLPDSSEDAAYGALLKQEFKDVGIVHLLAVSGGHFALLASLITQACARLRRFRALIPPAIAVSLCVLASLMYPSDSVIRALAMGVLAAACLSYGRPSQALSRLSWTVIFVLMLYPRLAVSFGFTLSCASVVGIVVLSQPFEKAIKKTAAAIAQKAMPRAATQAAAVTLAAQTATLPIQMLMSPAYAPLSVIANLIVTPVVTFSTLTGLLSLALSWWAPNIGFACAWVASLGTAVMSWCAENMSEAQARMMASVQSLNPAFALVVAAAIVIAAIVRMKRHRRQNRSDSAIVVMSTDMKKVKAWQAAKGTGISRQRRRSRRRRRSRWSQ